MQDSMNFSGCKLLRKLGGLSSGRTMDTINIANIQTVAEWTEQELPFKVISHCVATLGDNKIVITGGEDSEPYENPNVSTNVHLLNETKFREERFFK